MGDYQDFCESFGGDASDSDFMDNWLDEYANEETFREGSVPAGEGLKLLFKRKLSELKKISFNTDRNPCRNNIKAGYQMQSNFRNSPRWALQTDNHGGYGKNDHDFSHSGMKVWRDVNKGTLVKESYSTNRKGKVNSITFLEIQEWPESNLKSQGNYNEDLPF